MVKSTETAAARPTCTSDRSWLAWLGIHIFFLIGFRNRFVVMFNWAYSYLTFRRGARLITGVPPPWLRACPPKD
jgi:NADH dehydrogenase